MGQENWNSTEGAVNYGKAVVKYDFITKRQNNPTILGLTAASKAFILTIDI
jgi:hypothetical protein